MADCSFHGCLGCKAIREVGMDEVKNSGMVTGPQLREAGAEAPALICHAGSEDLGADIAHGISGVDASSIAEDLIDSFVDFIGDGIATSAVAVLHGLHGIGFHDSPPAVGFGFR